LNHSLKCFYPGTAHDQLADTTATSGQIQECIRVFFYEIRSVGDLKAIIEADLQVSASQCKFCYIDDDGDLVSFTSRTTLDELEEHAISVHVYDK
jgi:hypothetical protein